MSASNLPPRTRTKELPPIVGTICCVRLNNRDWFDLGPLDAESIFDTEPTSLDDTDSGAFIVLSSRRSTNAVPEHWVLTVMLLTPGAGPALAAVPFYTKNDYDILCNP